VVEVALNLGGYPIRLADTAGLRTTPGDVIEKEGIKRSQERAAEADILVPVFESGVAFDEQTLSLSEAHDF